MLLYAAFSVFAFLLLIFGVINLLFGNFYGAVALGLLCRATVALYSELFSFTGELRDKTPNQ